MTASRPQDRPSTAGPPRPPSPLAGQAARLWLLVALALVAVAAFLGLGTGGDWLAVLPFRGPRLAALLLVAYAVAVSTVLFQTITHNRILTPAVMGFDALYVLIQTVLVFSLGLERLGGIDARLKFGLEVLVMSALAWLLFRWLFGKSAGGMRSLHLTMLAGIVFGILFRSLTSFLMRLIDPNEFIVLQDRMFASFNLVAQDLLAVSALAVLAVSVVGWRLRRSFDVLGLGRELSINLGLDYRRLVMRILLLITVLVAVSTALVGPITFFGLLVASLAYQIVGVDTHRAVLPAAVLLGAIFLVGGQVVLERVFGFNSALSVVVEFLGGLMFLLLLLRRRAL
jgi:iron complex transport system permease protein